MIEDFAEGLKAIFMRGSLRNNIRLTKGMKKVILKMIEHSLENTSIIFTEDYQEKQYNTFMESMTWLKKTNNWRTQIFEN